MCTETTDYILEYFTCSSLAANQASASLSLAMGVFKGLKLFKKSAKKETQQDAAALTKVEEVVESTKAVVEPVAVEPAVEPAAAEDTVEALPEVKADL